jgi:hypothetical protein
MGEGLFAARNLAWLSEDVEGVEDLRESGAVAAPGGNSGQVHPESL